MERRGRPGAHGAPAPRTSPRGAALRTGPPHGGGCDGVRRCPESCERFSPERRRRPIRSAASRPTERVGRGVGGGPGRGRELRGRRGGGERSAVRWGPERGRAGALWLMCNWEQMAPRGGSVRAVRGRSAPRSAAPFPKGGTAQRAAFPPAAICSLNIVLPGLQLAFIWAGPRGHLCRGRCATHPRLPSPRASLYLLNAARRKDGYNRDTYRDIHAIKRSVGRLYGGSDPPPSAAPPGPPLFALRALRGAMRSSEPSGPPLPPLLISPSARAALPLRLRSASARPGSARQVPNPHLLPPPHTHTQPKPGPGWDRALRRCALVGGWWVGGCAQLRAEEGRRARHVEAHPCTEGTPGCTAGQRGGNAGTARNGTERHGTAREGKGRPRTKAQRGARTARRHGALRGERAGGARRGAARWGSGGRLWGGGVRSFGGRSFGGRCFGGRCFGVWCFGVRCFGVRCFGVRCFGVRCFGVQFFGVWCFRVCCFGVQSFGVQSFEVQSFGVHCFRVWCFGVQCFGVQCFGVRFFGVGCFGVQSFGVHFFGFWCFWV